MKRFDGPESKPDVKREMNRCVATCEVLLGYLYEVQEAVLKANRRYGDYDEELRRIFVARDRVWDAKEALRSVNGYYMRPYELIKDSLDQNEWNKYFDGED